VFPNSGGTTEKEKVIAFCNDYKNDKDKRTIMHAFDYPNNYHLKPVSIHDVEKGDIIFLGSVRPLKRITTNDRKEIL
jgi:hypothetical protein